MRKIVFGLLVLMRFTTLNSNEIFYTRKKEAYEIPIPLPSILTSSKWWSSSLFGNVHGRICKKVFEFIDPKEYPDLIYYRSEIIDGCGDENGHDSLIDNGGDVKLLWFGKKEVEDPSNEEDRFIMGVLVNYNLLNWRSAYKTIGAIVHLTQDQASPPHAANIRHSPFDQFERFYESDNNITLVAIDVDIPDNLKPWEYYLFVQKNTRIKLKEWIDPENGLPYWEEAPGALRLDEDNTRGPYGRYGGGKDHFMKVVCDNNECSYQPKSPEIRDRQITLAVLATEKLLKSASKSLPPVIRELKITHNLVKFTLYDNRCTKLSYFTDNGRSGTIELDKDFPFSKTIRIENDFSTITFIDCDGNETTKIIKKN